MAAETATPNQNTTTDNELRLNERIHKYWKDKYEKIRQQQQQELDHTIYSFNAKESKLLSKQTKTNEKLYQVQLEQDQLKKELEEAKMQLEQVRQQTEDTTSSSEEDERQRLGANPKQSRCFNKAINRHNSMPTLRNTDTTVMRQETREEKTVRRDTAYPQEDEPSQYQDPFLKYERPRQSYTNDETHKHHIREPFSASLREYRPLSDTRPDDYEEPFQFHRSGYIPNEEKYGHDMDMFRHTRGYQRETRGTTDYSPPIRSMEEIERERQKYQPPRINERQTDKDSKSRTLHLRAKAVIDNLTFDFRPFTVFKQYDRPGDPRRRQILLDLQAELKNRMDNYHRYTNIKLEQSRWLDPNDEIAVALTRLRSIYNNDLQTYEEIDYHLDKYRILQSTTVQKQLKARGRLVAPKFGTIPYAAHAFSLRGIEPINDKNSSNLRKILQCHLIQMESLCLTEDAMKTAMTFFLQGKPQDVFDQHYHKRLQSILDILCRHFDDGDLSYVDTLKKLETLTRKPREHIHSFYTTLNLEFSKTEFMTDPILYESQRDRYIRDKLMQHLGPKTKTEVLKSILPETVHKWPRQCKFCLRRTQSQ